MSNTIQPVYNFTSSIYLIDKPDFLETIGQLSGKYLYEQKQTQSFDPMYPVCMTNNFYNDPQAKEFGSFVADVAWKILESQGYAVSNMETFFTGMWAQEHYKMSGMDQHIHGFQDQIIGFYFLECPENSSKVVFHDPRPGKVQAALPEANVDILTDASSGVNFDPKPGQLILANSWLPHSFSRHGNDSPLTFIHFNLSVRPSNSPVIV